MERDLSTDEFQSFHDYIYRLTGIHYPAEKRPLLSNRLRRRLRATNIADYAAYLAHLQMGGRSGELQEFIDSVTTNETYFFRCQRHWDLFRDWAKQQGANPDAKRTGLRIWSAAASNGSEAYTMLIVLEQALGEGFGGLKVEVLGTDLNAQVLEEARTGVYRPYALGQTPPDVLKRYFEKVEEDRFQFARRLLPLVTFRKHNLMEPLSNRTFDFVFLRNVMIYFDKPSKERVLGNVRQVLRPGGMLLVGESESLLNINHQMTYLQPSLFQKPPTAPVRV